MKSRKAIRVEEVILEILDNNGINRPSYLINKLLLDYCIDNLTITDNQKIIIDYLKGEHKKAYVE